MIKECAHCHQEKVLETDFSVRNDRANKYRNYCKVCAVVRARKYVNPEKNRANKKRYYHAAPEKHRAHDLKKKFGITLADYDRLFEQQNGVCAICHRPPVGINLAVDHCHRTGRVRGLLCGHCNKALGLMGDSAEFLIRAAEYVQEALS